MQQSVKNTRLDLLKSDMEINRLLNLIKNDHEILAVVVFGSYLYQNSYRDIDLCLFTYKDDINPHLELKYRLYLPEKYDVRFFSKFPLYIQSDIMETGVILYNKDFDTLFDIYYKKIKEFNLFFPHFKTYLEAVKDG
ncbi:MAG: hypothetical protein ACTSWX_16345 [Promethearchaeota archaeon]